LKEFLIILLVIILLFLGFMILLYEQRLNSINKILEIIQKVDERIIEWMEIKEWKEFQSNKSIFLI